MHNYCVEEFSVIKGNIKSQDDLIHELDKRLAVTESNYGGITVMLDKLDNKIDGLKDIVVERKVQKEWRDKIKTFIYNSSMLVLGFIGIYDILFKLFGLK